MGNIMNEILDNYELFIIVFLVLLAITYAVFTFIIKKDRDSIYNTLLHRDVKDKEEPVEMEEEIITEEDRNLFKAILSYLPLNGESMKFLEHHNMEKSFHGSKLDDLYAFYYEGNGRKEKFPNKMLDEQRQKVSTLAAAVIEQFSKSLTLMEQGNVVVSKENSTLNEKIKKFIEAYKAFSQNEMLK